MRTRARRVPEATRALLRAVGHNVRRHRERRGLTQRELAAGARLSLRFLADLEGGRGNISLARFHGVAEALGVPAASLLSDGASRASTRVIALCGLRGAGKSTLGRRLGARLGVPFVELDRLIERAAGLTLAQIFELHGEAYFRRLERETLRRFLDETPAAVLATGGSLVTDGETWRRLRERAVTVWLRARPRDHWDRVVAQGDRRPMAGSPRAFAELRARLAARESLYAQAAHVIDTSRRTIDQAVEDLAGLAAA